MISSSVPFLFRMLTADLPEYSEVKHLKNIANLITLLRIVLAAAMLFLRPFSFAFWLCYFLAGLSDGIDGWIARRFHLQSDTGAKLDSIADLILAAAITIVVFTHIQIPAWVWLLICLTAMLRIISYGIGFYKYHTFSALHTYLNKFTGCFILMFPLLTLFFRPNFIFSVTCCFAVISAIEELLITITSNKLQRNRKCFFT